MHGTLPGELAEVLDMDEQDLAAKVIPCALPKLAMTNDMDGLHTLADLGGIDVPSMTKQHSLSLLAESIYTGEAKLHSELGCSARRLFSTA